MDFGQCSVVAVGHGICGRGRAPTRVGAWLERGIGCVADLCSTERTRLLRCAMPAAVGQAWCPGRAWPGAAFPLTGWRAATPMLRSELLPVAVTGQGRLRNGLAHARGCGD